jgi:hypothetical protein
LSLHGYLAAVELVKKDEPFFGLIMAAMMKADDHNLVRLKVCWPDVWDELEKRYHAPGGRLPEEE